MKDGNRIDRMNRIVQKRESQIKRKVQESRFVVEIYLKCRIESNRLEDREQVILQREAGLKLKKS